MESNPQSFQFQKNKKTTIIPDDFKRKRLINPNAESGTSAHPQQRTAIIFILGMVERINFDVSPKVILGRYDRHLKTTDQVDLSHYGAVERGVSREHCQLSLKDDQLTVMDLGSSNGTYIAGNRLEPHRPYVLNKGEELLLGRLPLQIMLT